MAGQDEYDDLLEDSFGEDVDWTAIEGMAGPSGALGGGQEGAGPGSEGYFDDDDGFMDEAFLAELRRLEDRLTDGAVSASGSSRTGPSAAPESRQSDQRWSPSSAAPSTTATGSSSSIQPVLRAPVIAFRPSISVAGPSTQIAAAPLPPTNRENRSPYFRDPPHTLKGSSGPATSTLSAAIVSTHTALSRKIVNDKTSSRSSPLKRSRPSASSSEESSPIKKRITPAREEVSEVLKTFEGALECPICFDLMAASHVLSCGHAACGICLSKWLRLKGKKATCYSCRALHKGPLIPNFTVDNMATTYFDELYKNRLGGSKNVSEEKSIWEKRKAEGKAAVQAAMAKRPTKPAPAPAPAPTVPAEEDYYDDDDDSDYSESDAGFEGDRDYGHRVLHVENIVFVEPSRRSTRGR